ncbi:MarR family winged helix-turn-helix transcriptional regulator [Roseibium sediminis]|uniref:MarR family winged helix-turn-helix transcriptional regulator n=1 Tax=Roseibium sediminis TaxID=1775174 RepID=UPI001AD8AD5F|nr:MarR family transcriptional regulator [Roseibium sediminis]
MKETTTLEQGQLTSAPQPTQVVPYDLIELLFFAYREFTSDPDDVLAQYGFGRAHHRVLHFVDRHPGIMVTDLLGILKITKQSLGRVLKQLVDDDFIEQRAGAIDRRQRLLHTTNKGHELAVRLARLQTERLDRAIKDLPNGTTDTVKQFLFQMIDATARREVANLINVGPDLDLTQRPDLNGMLQHTEQDGQ